MRDVDGRDEPGHDEWDEDMRLRVASAEPWLLFALIVGWIFNFAVQPAIADEKIRFCATGTIKLGSFRDHLAVIRKARRYEPADISDLIKKERRGGPNFFSSQVVIKEEQSGSGDFDLHLFQGFSDPHAKYEPVKKWDCDHDDYPVAYFVGFKVREISDGAIFVSRDKGMVNIISLKEIDPKLEKGTSVKVFHSGAVLCQDIAKGCVRTIFYGSY
jgi:hypothetical protein